jgi:hypothetical protein
MIFRRLCCLLCLIVITGCRTDARAGETPALLVAPDANTQAELQRLVSTALGGVSITLSDAALTDSSLLIIERKPHVDASGARIMGRDLEMPEQFQLIKQGSVCLLEQIRTGERWPLQGAVCVVAPVER